MPSGTKELNIVAPVRVETFADVTATLERWAIELKAQYRRLYDDIGALETQAADHEARITVLEGP